MKIAREGEWRPSALGGSAGVSGDVLSGRDCECSWEDVFRGTFIVTRWFWIVSLSVRVGDGDRTEWALTTCFRGWE